jgi:arabinofuranosyltransferase
LNKIIVFCLTTVILLSAWLFLPFAGPVDDAFITMTYSRNIADGKGIVFNEGENVEGCTAFGQMMILALFSFLGVERLDIVAVILGILSWAGTLTLCYAFYQKQTRDTPGYASDTFDVLFGLYLIAAPISMIWATSGMETPIVALLWMVAFLAHLGERKKESWPVFSSLATVGAALMRPDGILVAIPLGLSWLWPARKKSLVRGLMYGALVTALFGGYWIWRWNHFGYFWPNTFAAKVGSPSLYLAASGLYYLVRAGISLAFPIAFIFILLKTKRKTLSEMPRWFWVAAGLAVTASAYVVIIGGDFFPYFRFLVPALVPGSLAFWKLYRNKINERRAKEIPEKQSRKIRPQVVILLLFVWCSWSAFSLALQFVKANLLVEWTQNWSYVGKELKRVTPPDAFIATLPIGAIGYYSDRKILDIVGLTNLHIGRKAIETGKHIVGHEKHDTQYILDQRPDLILTWPDLYKAYPKKAKVWLHSHTIAAAQRRIYLAKRTHRLYTPMSLKTSRGYVLGLIRNDIVGKEGWESFRPLNENLKKRLFNPVKFRTIKKPKWKDIFSSKEKKTGKKTGGK